ncbi:MAG: hypothetical protein PVG39_25770 [Desulfobacteraceae bacterium]
MEKIVILTSGPDHDSKLIKCLKALFPECEIDIRERMPGDNDSADIIFENDDDMALGEDIEKYLSFL